MNVAVKNILIEIKGLLLKEAERHTPEGSDAEAVVDQWIHALATNTDFYCDNSNYKPQSVKNLVCKILENANYFESSDLFYNIAFENLSLKPQSKPNFTFIDLFAGIGGIRLGFQKYGGACVFSSEFEKAAQNTYKENFGEHPFGDITTVPSENIPKHDILLGGFPCQAFSVAGYREGFSDKKGRGNLFFKIHDIIKTKKPEAFLLENVKNLQGHDGGNTFKVIVEYLHESGYSVISNVLNSMDFGDVPQNRERIYIIGFKDEANWQNNKGATRTSEFSWPEPIRLSKSVRDLLDKQVSEHYFYERFACYKQLKEQMTRKDTVYQWRRVYVRENKNNVCPTLTANMGTGGHNVPLILDDNGRIRKLTPKECSRIQGFPEDFKLPHIANSHLYKQFGNSVTVPVIERLANEMLRVMNKIRK
ncbi:DNA cytosine methyltransferase [Kangiella koreensis]|uniref:Cytosine-specific methyltransferase n=1 Tax=Kangiella koreensis (strain DSM 16069 / JCM 12317 / KCTC 12182 / SW-125) TaxID=523791 RepID=C7RCX7_KANKD|nr:DNA cytosine methyltransferase [Kangiella koreensis]ACV27119.1 DNA-cytosine methyltransferase [Kangiella koreensis DSM 16069]